MSEVQLAHSQPVSKTDLVKEVTKTAEEAQLEQDKARVKPLEKEYEQYRQSKGVSLYCLLEEIKDLALLDVSVDSGA